MEWLARMNGSVLFVGTLVLVLLGLFLPGLAGGIVLLALAAAVFVLFARAAPARPASTRVIQGLIIVGLIGAALLKIM